MFLIKKENWLLDNDNEKELQEIIEEKDQNNRWKYEKAVHG